MRSDPSNAALADIRRHIDLARRFLTGIDRSGLNDDLRTLYAVIRCLEIISEASRRVSNEVKARHPSIAWRQIAAAGNVYRHDYEDVAAQLIWDTVHGALAGLEAAVNAELADRN